MQPGSGTRPTGGGSVPHDPALSPGDINASQTRQFFDISRSQCCVCLRKYREAGVNGPKDAPEALGSAPTGTPR